MNTSLTLDTEIAFLDRAFEQSRNSLVDFSDFTEFNAKTSSELEILGLTLGWLCVGNDPMAYSGVKALVDKASFGWACGAYVAWTGDDYILTELEFQINKWKYALDQERSFPKIYKEIGARALMTAYHSRRDPRSAHGFEEYLDNLENKWQNNHSNVRDLDCFLQASVLPDTPEQFATILGIEFQGSAEFNANQSYSFWKQLSQHVLDSTEVTNGNSSAHIFLSSLSITCFLHGLLRMRPDVPSGRIKLSPNIPHDLTSFGVQNLRVGSNTLNFKYSHHEGEHTFIAEQNRGQIPLNLVFQPNVYGCSIENIYIDEELADLEWNAYSATSRVGTQVQLYLEKQRTVTIVSK